MLGSALVGRPLTRQIHGVSNSASHLLGIDEGTTGVRAVVTDPSGTIQAQAYAKIPAVYPQPGWVEHHGETLWQTTRAVIERALGLAGLEAADIAAIGIANQRGSAVAFDPRGHPVGPVIGWQDQRTSARCVELFDEGLFVIPNTAASKYEWLLQNHARGRRDIRLGTVDAYLACRLSAGSVFASDHSNYSVSGLYDLFAGTVDLKTAAVLGIEPGNLPALVDTSGVIGETDRTAFGACVPIAALAGDQHAAMYAQAAHAKNAIELELGTSGMVKRNEGKALGESPAGSYPLVLWSFDGERTFCVESPVLTAGAAAAWLCEGLGIISDVTELESLARSVSNSDGVWVVPAFAGLGGPHLELGARGMIGGLSRGSTHAHIARATLEGIAARCGEAALALAGGPLDRLRVAGGAAKNGLLLQMLADVTGAVVERPRVLDRAGIGAALLAGRGLGLVTDAQVAASWEPYRSFEPIISADERGARQEVWSRRIALVRSAVG